MNLYKTGRRYDVEPLFQQLQGWNEVTLRTAHPRSPHRDTSDIWIRYNAMENYAGDMQQFNDIHESVWYPIVEKIPDARRLSEELAQGAQIGAIFITRIPPGKQVHPHIDQGWHARHYDKFAIQIRGNERQSFHVERESIVTVTGDEFYFNNSVPHWVKNNSNEDRITMIVCTRKH